MKYLLLSLLFLSAFFLSVAQDAKPLTRIVVAQDGSGNFTRIQQAIESIRAYSPEHITVFIKKGMYNEKIHIPAWITNVSIVGESREQTIISNADYSGKFINADTVNNKQKFSTFTSYTMYVQGNDISIENLTIQNTAGRVGQAVAIHVDGDRFIIRNCNLLGNQDTLLTANDSSRQYFENCYITGTTDFIFGNATAVFNTCTIQSLKNSYITAASTSANQRFGYVFMRCKLIADDKDSVTQVYLGRPWRAYAKVVFIACELGKHIRPEGWHNWNKTENESTAYYAEYKNYGPGAAVNNRVNWSRQLTEEEAKQYIISNIFNGWNP